MILQTLNYHKDEIYKIIELKNKSLVSCSWDKSIIFYNKDNNNKYIQDYKIISKELLLIPGINKISIINIYEYEIIRIIDIPYSNSIIGVWILNYNILFTGDSNKVIREWKIEGDNLILISKKENAHNDYIKTLINIGDGHISSGSDDKLIKIW